MTAIENKDAFVLKIWVVEVIFLNPVVGHRGKADTHTSHPPTSGGICYVKRSAGKTTYWRLEPCTSCAGIGRAACSRADIFRERSGVAITMEERVFRTPACNGVLPGLVMLQNLPSLVAALVLNPSPGAMVLDMCASPGGER